MSVAAIFTQMFISCRETNCDHYTEICPAAHKNRTFLGNSRIVQLPLLAVDDNKTISFPLLSLSEALLYLWTWPLTVSLCGWAHLSFSLLKIVTMHAVITHCSGGTSVTSLCFAKTLQQ